MNRVIKFRGKSVIHKKWVYGSFVLCTHKKGNEIYEGDIIHLKGNTIDKEFGVVTYHKNGYFYIDDSFGNFPRDCVKPIGDFFNSISRNDFFQGMEFYVSGNIHDSKKNFATNRNPELKTSTSNDNQNGKLV